LAFGRTTAFGPSTTFGHITVGCCTALQLHHIPNCVTVADGLFDLIGFSNISLSIIGLINCIIGRNGLINFVVSMVLPRPNSLVGLLTLADCWIVSSLGDLGLISALWVF
jgi:hypothetical protein